MLSLIEEMEDETGRDYAEMRRLVVEAIMREIDNG